MLGKWGWKLSSCCSIIASLTGLIVVDQLSKDGKQVSAQLKKLAKNNCRHLPSLSVLVPVRNEQATIVECLETILSQDYPDFEVIVVDDNSTDQTPHLLHELTKSFPRRLRVIKASPPSPGWLGKNNALWQGYAQDAGASKWLLFADADTRLAPFTLRAAVSYAEQEKLDLLSLVPKMRLKGFWARLTTPEIGKLYVVAAQNPFRLHPRPPGGSAVGPFILVRRQAYQAVDGHRGIKGSIIEDVALARNIKAKGFATFQGLGFDFVERDWYETLPELWRGVGKNLFSIANKSWSTVAVVLLMQACYGLLPLILLGWRLSKIKQESLEPGPVPTRADWALSGAAITLTLISQSESYRTLDLPRRYALLYPLSVLISALLMLYSAVSVDLLHSVSWKGRSTKEI